jgi:LysM repeat protein
VFLLSVPGTKKHYVPGLIIQFLTHCGTGSFFYFCQNRLIMRDRFILYSLIIFVSIFHSCKTAKPVVIKTTGSFSDIEYVNRYKDLAVSEMRRTGIPASITIAQGIIESDQGRSSLATEANNHFGIKCHDDWNGPIVKHNDDRRNECFRKYSRAEESFKDHSDFLRSEQRYRFLFSLDKTDYKGWAKGLKKAGYATNPNYAEMLIRKIEELNLWQYDKDTNISLKPAKKDTSALRESTSDAGQKKSEIQTGSSFTIPSIHSRIQEKNRIQYIIVKESDTKETIENEFQLLKWEIARYNDLQPDFKLRPGQLLYLQPKREKADAGNDFHTAEKGESMYAISQQYGIKLKSLLTMNRMVAGQEPSEGQKIWLRSVKPIQ